jgi:hypothetical protein
MTRRALRLPWLTAGMIAWAGCGWGQEPGTAGQARTFTFDGDSALAGWAVSGEVSLDRTHGRGGQGAALKVSPGGRAPLKLRDNDASGKVELWVEDGGTQPDNVKLNRAGPRWGLVQNDGRVLAVGVLYASYLGGTEKAWNHDVFFDYVDRWMYENDAGFVKTIKEATGKDHDKDWARQGQAWDAFVNEMWSVYRRTLPASTDGWIRPHDDSYYRAAIARSPN